MQIIYGLALAIFSFLAAFAVGPFFIAAALVLGLVAGLIARSKGRNLMSWWLYGTLLAFIAIPHALIIKRDQSRIDAEALANGMKKCPSCAEIVRAEAAKCKHCGHEFSVTA